MTDSELLELLAPERLSIEATQPERAERYARLARDCEARRARDAFHVVT
jgi:hypothetical protein